MDYSQKALELHKKLKGKIKISSKVPLTDKDILSTLYTPGVGAVSRAIADDKSQAWTLTGKGNSVAIVSDGTAVLGLSNIGPEAALPVMEGKAAFFAEFGNINAFPLCIQAESVDSVINFVRAIVPTFGGVNLEDIKAPECFEIEEKLQDLGIPVFHDDQDGAAIVTLAGLVNAAKASGKNLGDLKVVIMGAGAAGAATAWLLLGLEKWTDKKVGSLFFAPPKDLILVDSEGIIVKGRKGLTKWKEKLAVVTNKGEISGSLAEALKDADVFIGLSNGGKLDPKLISQMNKNPIIFALANPNPEINPDDAKKAGASIVGTGRSDFPNQVNNALVFPCLFRGLLDARAKQVTAQVKYAVAEALCTAITPTADQILPSVLDITIHKKVSQAVQKAV